MVTYLAAHLERLGELVRWYAWRDPAQHVSPEDVTEAVAHSIFVLDRIENAAGREQPPRPDWDEVAARRWVPAFKTWFEHATVVAQSARACKAQGHPVEGLDEFLHRYNISKMMARDFEQTVEQYRRFQRGEMGRGSVTLSEASHELHRPAGAAGA